MLSHFEICKWKFELIWVPVDKMLYQISSSRNSTRKLLHLPAIKSPDYLWNILLFFGSRNSLLCFRQINVGVSCCRTVIQGLPGSIKTVNSFPSAAAAVHVGPLTTLSPQVGAAATRWKKNQSAGSFHSKCFNFRCRSCRTDKTSKCFDFQYDQISTMVNLLLPIMKDFFLFLQLLHGVLLLLALPVVRHLAEDWKKINFPRDFLGAYF